MTVALVSLAVGQETRVYREGGNWAQSVTGNLEAARILRVKVDSGNVRVEGDSQSGVSYFIHRRAYTSSEDQARRAFDSYKISAYVKGDTAYILAEWQGRRSRKCAGDFAIKVPRNIELTRVDTDGGNITVLGIAGRAEMQSGGGSIRLDDIAGSVTAETGGGTIDVGTVGNDVNVRTGGGNIKIASAKGKISAESGGGSVVVVSGLQGAIVETGGGNIHVDKCQGNVRASTGGGSKLNGVPSARAETGGGGIIAKFLSSSDAHSDSWLETGAGDVTVYLASDLAISIRAAIEMANGHSIQAGDFPDIHVNSEGGQWGPKTVTAEGKLNGGGPTLKVRTSTGNIIFRRVSH